MDIFARNYAPNPSYGSGVFRRRVRLIPEAGRITAVMNDCFHSIRITLDHDGRSVTGVASALDRAPKTTCPSASGPIRELVGLPLDSPRSAFFRDGRAARNCTHLLDLSVLALGAVGRGDGPLVYDVAMPDIQGGRTTISVDVNDHAVHRWTIEGETISAPAPLATRPLFKGFAAWSSDLYEGIELDAARLAQKAFFAGRGRAFIVDGPVPVRARDETHRTDDCFSFTQPQQDRARDLVGYVRDYTGGIDEPNLPSTSELQRGST